MKYMTFFLFFVSTISTSAQEKSNIKIGLFSNIGIESISCNKLNTLLTDNNYFECSNIVNYESFGLNLRNLESQSAMRIFFYNGKNGSSSLKDNSSLNLYGLELDYLYDLLKTEDWLIAPTVGISMNNCYLNAVSKNNTSTLSGKNIVENFQIKNLFLLNAGIEIDRKIKISFLNVYLGVKGYYKTDLQDKTWSTSSQESIKTLPTIDFSGFGASFNVKIEFNWENYKRLK